jgi:hypothetical protein
MSANRLFTTLLFSGTLLLHANILDDFMDTITPTSAKHPTKKRHKKQLQKPLLSEGAQWQTALQFLGYYQGKIDGDLSSEETFHAVTVFHTKYGQVPTGFLEEPEKVYLSRIYRMLYLSRYLAYEGKSKAKYYQKLQAALTLLSLYHGTIDGNFGKHSKKALRMYQERVENGQKSKEKKSLEYHLVHDAKVYVKKTLQKFQEEPFDPVAYRPNEAEVELALE